MNTLLMVFPFFNLALIVIVSVISFFLVRHELHKLALGKEIERLKAERSIAEIRARRADQAITTIGAALKRRGILLSLEEGMVTLTESTVSQTLKIQPEEEQA